MTFRTLSLLFVCLTPACLTSTGQNGVEGNVRFSQVQHFVETSDFSAPLVTDSGLLVQLEFPNANDEVINPDLTLLVTDGKGNTASAHADVLPLGFAQYAIALDAPGSYMLVADEDGQTLDTLPITVNGASGLRFHDTADVVVTDTSGNTACGSGAQVSLGDLVLTNDASITFHVVPTDGNGNAMLGLLELTATTTGPIELTGDYLGQGLAPNSFSVSPKGTLGAPALITVNDDVTGKTITFQLQTKDANAGCQN